METRRRAYLYGMAFLMLCAAALSWGACAPECTAPQVLKDGKCTDPSTEDPGETAPADGDKPKERVSAEPRSEPPAKEPGKEPVVQDKGKEQVSTPDEPASTPDEPAAQDASVDAKPKEEVPEPRGPDPTVSILEPKDKAIVSGEITIKVDAKVSGGPQIAHVELQINGQMLHKMSKAPFEYKYDTKSLKDGDHKLAAIAVTTWGKQAKQEITITTSNSGPQIAIISPKASGGVSAAFDIEVSVTASQGVKSVTLEVDGQAVAWTSTTPNYKVQFDPTKKPFDSFPIVVKAEDKQGKKAEKEIWVVHDPAPGPITESQPCDNSDAKKRCIAGHSCLLVDPVAGKSVCKKHCVVGGPATQCPSLGSKTFLCQVAFQGTTRGACAEGPPQPGSLYTQCGNINNKSCKTDSDCTGVEVCNQNVCIIRCQAGMICVGATRPNQPTISYCLKTCLTVNQPCSGDPGFLCVGLQGGGGACIEQCGHKCTSDSNCATGQKCTNNVCSTPYCQKYGQCVSVGLPAKVCI